MSCSRNNSEDRDGMFGIPGMISIPGGFRKVLDELGIPYNIVQPKLMEINENTTIPPMKDGPRGLYFALKYLQDKKDM